MICTVMQYDIMYRKISFVAPRCTTFFHTAFTRCKSYHQGPPWPMVLDPIGLFHGQSAVQCLLMMAKFKIHGPTSCLVMLWHFFSSSNMGIRQTQGLMNRPAMAGRLIIYLEFTSARSVPNASWQLVTRKHGNLRLVHPPDKVGDYSCIPGT